MPELTQFFYRPAEAAAILGRGRTTVYAAIASGDLRSCKQGRSRLIPADAISDYAKRLAETAA